EPAVLVEKAVVDRPRVDADRVEPAVEVPGQGVRAPYPDADALEKPVEVPAQAAADAPRRVVEPMRFAQLQRGVARSPENRTTAPRAEVDREMEGGRRHAG